MRFFFFLLTLFFCGCSSQPQTLRVGIDRQWFPIDFASQTSYVNAFTENLLLEMSHYSGIQFELINANWDNLMSGLKEKKFDAILTSMPPYEYNQAKFSFSDNFLQIGPVLIVPSGSKKNELKKFKDELVGIISNDPAVRILEKYPNVIIRNYHSIPDLFNALMKGEIQGAVLDQIPAISYIHDLYAGVLKIVGQPMSDAGLHLVGGKRAVDVFNQGLHTLKRKDKLDQLLKKWELIPFIKNNV